jgi:hypothetical protein
VGSPKRRKREPERYVAENWGATNQAVTLIKEKQEAHKNKNKP